jgi:hypothetical protein
MMLELASNGGPPPRAMLLIIAVAGLGLVGIVTVALLLSAWRRFNERQREQPPLPENRTTADLWQIAGQRLQPHENDPQDEDDGDEGVDEDEGPRDGRN